jgi:hypothetical protein
MTQQDSGGDRGDSELLRAAFARAVDGVQPSSAPVGRILAAGRARRSRRRLAVVTAVAASVAAAGLTVPLYRPAGAGPAPAPARTAPAAPPARTGPAPAATSASPSPAGVVRTPLGQGEAGGVPWSAALRFYPRAPAGAPGPAVLCVRRWIGGSLVDAAGGPWADCQAVRGTADPVWRAGGAALYGFQDKGLSGPRIVIAPAAPGVATAVVALTGGGSLHATAATVPGTAYGGWAVAVPSGRHIAAVRVYAADGRLLGTDTGLY